MPVAKKRAQSHYSVFERQVSDILSCVSWVNSAESFIRASYTALNWDYLRGSEREAVFSHERSEPLDNQSLVNSLYVTTAAAFEEFCRLVIQAVCEELNDNRITLGEDQNLQRFLIYSTSRFLTRIHSPPAHVALNEDELCQSIGSMSSQEGPVKVVGEAISDISGILELESVLSQLNKLNKQISWDILSRDAGIKAVLSTRKNNETKTELRALLASVSKNRNRIAHVGPSSADVTEEVLESHATALLAIGDAIVRNL